jgi:hypothetical protein
MRPKNFNAAFVSEFLPRTDEQIADELAACVRDASLGDRRAIGCLAIALGGYFHDEARLALGPRHEQAAADVVQDLYLGLLERRFPFPEIQGCALLWLRRVIRSLAAEIADRVVERRLGVMRRVFRARMAKLGILPGMLRVIVSAPSAIAKLRDAA